MNIQRGGSSTGRDGVGVTWRGTAFQLRAVATGKARLLTVYTTNLNCNINDFWHSSDSDYQVTVLHYLQGVHIHGFFLRVVTDGQLVVTRKHP